MLNTGIFQFGLKAFRKSMLTKFATSKISRLQPVRSVLLDHIWFAFCPAVRTQISQTCKCYRSKSGSLFRSCTICHTVNFNILKYP